MRPGNSAQTAYSPGPVPSEPAELQRYLREEFEKLAAAVNAPLQLSVTYVAPPKPREGMVRFADGTSWNPGAGRGPYVYRGTAWVALI